MADKLTDAFNDFKAENNFPTDFQLFQAGYSSSAVSMRKRALDLLPTLVKGGKIDVNDALTAIGKLPDIPTE